MGRGRGSVSGTGKRIRAQILVPPLPSQLSAGWVPHIGLLGGLSEAMASNCTGLDAKWELGVGVGDCY